MTIDRRRFLQAMGIAPVVLVTGGVSNVKGLEQQVNEVTDCKCRMQHQPTTVR